MFRIGELAKFVGVNVDTIRHYTRMGLLTPVRDARNGYQCYTEEDARWAKFILHARRLGYSLTEIEHILHEARQDAAVCPKTRRIIESRIGEHRQRLDELQRFVARLEGALKRWETMPSSLPDSESVRRLIQDEEG